MLGAPACGIQIIQLLFGPWLLTHIWRTELNAAVCDGPVAATIRGTTMYRRALLTAASAAAFAVTALASGPASAISTYKDWDGTSLVEEFGCPNTTTYGQVITIPNNRHFMNNFAFSWENLDSGSMVVRGEVYAWDGTKASGSGLWEGVQRTITYNDGAIHRIHFNTGVLAVTPGAQYVVFASIDKDFEQCQNSYILGWGLVTSGDVYPGGGFVYQNNGGDESQWTLTPWNTFGGEDLAFKVGLSP
jgi:hypothetical protein